MIRPRQNPLIIFSVFLNLVLIGIVIGHMGTHMFSAERHEHHMLSQLADVFTNEKRAHFEDIVTHFDQDTGELHEQISEARKKAIKLIKTDNFDKDVYLAQINEMQKLRALMISKIADIIGEMAQQGTPEERAKMAEILRTPHHHPEDD